MRFTQVEFIDAIENYELMCKEEDQIINALSINPEWKPSKWIEVYYTMIFDMCDFSKDDYDIGTGSFLLDFYCYELNFGKGWEPGAYTVEGEDVPLRNSYDLWVAITG